MEAGLRPAASADIRPATAAAGLVVRLLAVSLEGLELRLSRLGEPPHFVEVEPGHLRHCCISMDARVSFWPSSLKWTAEGRQRSLLEEALMAPLLDEQPGASLVPPPPPPPPLRGRKAAGRCRNASVASSAAQRGCKRLQDVVDEVPSACPDQHCGLVTRGRAAASTASTAHATASARPPG